MCQNARKNLQDEIEVAKARWASHLAQKVHNMRLTPKEAWKAVKDLCGVLAGHHVKQVTMRFKISTGKLSRNATEHMLVLWPHFSRVFNNIMNIDWSDLNKLKQRQ